MRNTAALQAAGFALTEALVALLLLAIAMLGASAAVVHSIAGQRAAMLRTRAADLAGNLAEGLRAAPDAASAAAEIESWQTEVSTQLPQATPVAAPRIPPPPAAAGLASLILPAQFDIRLQWRDTPSGTPSQLMLPLAVGTTAGSP